MDEVELGVVGAQPPRVRHVIQKGLRSMEELHGLKDLTNEERDRLDLFRLGKSPILKVCTGNESNQSASLILSLIAQLWFHVVARLQL